MRVELKLKLCRGVQHESDNKVVAEATRLSNALFDTFYDESIGNFSSAVAVNGTYKGRDSKNIFVLWSAVIALAGVVDGEYLFASGNHDLVEKCYDILCLYKNTAIPGSYTASEYFVGNNDIYYDDDAQVGSCLIYMYKATHNAKYLEEAKATLDFLLTGYNSDPNVAHGGGMYWNYSKEYVNACTTSECALVALRFLSYCASDFSTVLQTEKASYLEFAKNCVLWELRYLRDPKDNLIWDGISLNNQISTTKYSYNSGTLLSALCYLFKLTHEDIWLTEAHKIVKSVLNHDGSLFGPQCYGKSESKKKYWTDHNYFIQLLFEGLVDYLTTIESASMNLDSTLRSEIYYELKRHLAFYSLYCYDDKDKLYFSSFQPYKLSLETHKRYCTDFGHEIPFQPDSEDREISQVPVEQRKLTKTLIGLGSAVRMFYLAGKLIKNVDDYAKNPYN